MVFIPNRNLGAELSRQQGFLESLTVPAAEVAKKAESLNEQARIRPRGSRAIVIELDLGGVRVVNSDYGGVIAEYGSVKSPPYAPLRRGARAAGLRLEESDSSDS